jgi:undecaprenyl-diphosphatase
MFESDMSYLHAFILAIVEGITEFLPISSTAHLILVGKLLRLPETEFLKSFDIAIQLGAILAVVSLWFKRLLKDWKLIQRVVVAFIPTAIVGGIFYPLIKGFMLGSTSIILWSLLIGGIVLMVFEFLHEKERKEEKEVEEITYKQALGIGLFQSLAVIPGVSRSASTILGGMWLGLKRKTAVEFSFLVAIPTMGAAVGLDLLKNAASFSRDQLGLMMFGCVVSFLIALASVKAMTAFVRGHTFLIFGFYRIMLALLLFWIL